MLCSFAPLYQWPASRRRAQFMQAAVRMAKRTRNYHTPIARNAGAAAFRAAARVLLGSDDAVILQRERADTLARRREIRVEHRGRRHRDGGLADAAPESA